MTTMTSGLQCHELSCQSLHRVDRTAGPTLFDPKVAAGCPSQCLQSLNEGRAVAKPFGVACNFPPQYGNLAQCRPLRARRKRPYSRCTTNKRYELAPPHFVALEAQDRAHRSGSELHRERPNPVRFTPSRMMLGCPRCRCLFCCKRRVTAAKRSDQSHVIPDQFISQFR